MRTDEQTAVAGMTATRRLPRAHTRAALIIVLAALGNAVIATRGFLFADDYRASSWASVDPWSATWILGWQSSSHFSPLERLHYSVFVELAPLTHALPVAVTTVQLVLLLGLSWLVFCQLLGPNWGLVALAILAFSPLLAATNAWLVQAISLYGVIIGLQIAVLALLRYLRTPGLAWIGLGAAGWLIAALTWETWLIGPPLLGLLVVSQQTTGSLVDRVRTAWRAAEPFWLMSLAMIGGYLAVWMLGGYGTEGTLPSVLASVGALWTSLYLLVVPGFLGGPWQWFAPEQGYSPIADPPRSLIVLVAVCVTLAAAAAFRTDLARAWRGLLLFVVPTMLSMLLPILGRLTVFPYTTPAEPRYVAPSLTFAALGMTMLLQALHPERWQPRRGWAGTALVAVLVVGLGVTMARFTTIWGQNPGGQYVSNAKAGLAQAPAGSGIFNTEVPPSVIARWFTPYNTTKEMLRPLDPEGGARYGSADSARMFDGEGRLVPARFYPLTWANLASCQLVLQGQAETIALPIRQLHLENLTMRVEITTESAGTLHFETQSGDEAVDPTSTGTLELTPGRNERFVLLHPSPLASVRVTSDVPVCIESLVVGQPDA